MAAIEPGMAATWLLCSDWPLGILAPSLGFADNDTSRDMTWLNARWPAALAQVLSAGDDETADAIKLYNALRSPSNGAPALIVATGGFLSQVVADINDYLMRQSWVVR